MEQMTIDKSTTIAEVVEMYPQSFSLFRQLGICCLNDRNKSITLEDLSLSLHAEPGAFLEALKKNL